MEHRPINNLNSCSFKGCGKESEILVQRMIGDRVLIFGYCQFHSIISATFFSAKNRIEVWL